MRFEEAYGEWSDGQLTQKEAAAAGCEQTFRLYFGRFNEAGVEGLIDSCLNQVSQRARRW